MTIAKIGKITGPPGCGKTTELHRLIDAACDRLGLEISLHPMPVYAPI